jgi:hypothetical protein
VGAAMFFIFQIGGAILIAILVMAWWREIGAVTSAILGSGLLLLLAACLTWGDLLALSVIGVIVVGAVWLGARYEALEWDEAEDEFRAVTVES